MSNIDDDPGAPANRVRPDATQPRNQLIAIYTVLSVGALFGVKYGMDAYLELNTSAVRRGHLEESVAIEALAEYRAEAAATLEGGEMPIDEAIAQLADRGRAAFVQIRPTTDDSDAARLGWATLPATVPEAPPHATRSEYSLSPEEMPPLDPELEAYEAALDALPPGAPPPAAPRAPRAPPVAPAP